MFNVVMDGIFSQQLARDVTVPTVPAWRHHSTYRGYSRNYANLSRADKLTPELPSLRSSAIAAELASYVECACDFVIL